MDTDRERRLEEALLEYVELYGLSAKARGLFREGVSDESRQTETGPDQRNCARGSI